MVISSFCYSFAASSFFSPGAFYALSYVSRLAQGVADAQICVALFSFTSIQFTEEPAKYMGFMQGSLALGMLLGPCISAIVYAPFHYWGTFFFYGCTILVFGVGAGCMLPKFLNKDGATRAEIFENHENDGEIA